MAQLPPDSHCASWSQTPEPVLAGAAAGSGAGAGAGAGASYSAASASSLSDEDEEDELEGAALVAGPVRSRSMTWPTKIRSGFSMPVPAATAAQLSGASFESVSPGWTTCGRCVGAAPLTSAKPTTPMEATAAATAARFMVRLSNSFPSVGVRVSRSTDRGPVSRGSPPHSVAPFRPPQRASNTVTVGVWDHWAVGNGGTIRRRGRPTRGVLTVCAGHQNASRALGSRVAGTPVSRVLPLPTDGY